METCRSLNEMSVKMLAAAATDEVLVEAAKLGIAPLLRNCGGDIQTNRSRRFTDHKKPEGGGGRDSGCMDQSLRSSKHGSLGT
jgi:hypothetical protein